jgi:hypothetical protein
MNLTLTCKCGKKFQVKAQDAGKETACPGCGKRSKIPTLKRAPLPSLELDPPRVQTTLEVEEEVRLQELTPPPRTVEPAKATVQEIEEGITLQPLSVPTLIKSVEAAPMVLPVEDEEDDGSGGYGVDLKAPAAGGLETGEGAYCTLSTIAMDEHVPCIAYGVRGEWALAGQGDDALLVNMNTKKAGKFFEDHEAEVTSVALSASEPLALSADADGVMYLWDVRTQKRRKKFNAHDGAVLAVALSPDGKFAASGGEDSLIHLWDLTTGKRRDLEYADWDEWEEVATFVGFSRDSKQLLAGGDHGRACLWSVATGDRIKRYSGLELPISTLRLSDEGGTLTAATHAVRAGGTNYLVVCHWDTKTGKPQDQFNIAVDSTPCCIIPDRGGKRIIISGGGTDPWMGVWSLERGQCRHIYDDLRGSPISLAVSPLNNRIIAAMHNERLQLFGLEPF